MRRQAFTLVELLVAMTLTLFVMVVLTEAFSSAIDAMRSMKGLGDMQDNLRTAATILQNDLNQNHFEGRRRLSDPAFWLQPRREGFFVVYQGGAPAREGNDSDGIDSYRTTDHVLHFSIRKLGNKKQNFLQAAPPAGSPILPTATNMAANPTNVVAQTMDMMNGDPSANVFSSQWGEIAYFLAPQGTTAAGVPLFSLYRSQMVVLPYSADINAGALVSTSAFGSYAGFSCVAAANVTFRSPNDLANGLRAFDPATAAAFRGRASSSLLLDNVVSFEVKVMKTTTGGNFGHLAAGGGATFDSNVAPAATTDLLQGVRITLRVYDQATQQTRQITLVSEL